MKRSVQSYKISDQSKFTRQLFAWSYQFETAMWLDSNQYNQKYSSFEAALAVDDFTSIKTDYFSAFDKLKEYQSQTQDYLFGYISYDVKNDTEKITSKNFDGLHFPDLYFFQPKKLIFIKENQVEFHYLTLVDDEIESDYQAICHQEEIQNSKSVSEVKIKLRIHKDDYYEKVNKTLEHIHRGDIYEANFCQEFYAEDCEIEPHSVFKDLNSISEPPFAVFFRHEDHYLLSASPERYLRKEGSKIISQPIKGTAKRLLSRIDDEKIAHDLMRDEKERAENVMIVDLVRNDLSKSSKKGSVKVEELCKAYTFKQVHQLISTVVSELKDEVHPVDVIKDTFPMGSMTGAPKVSAMEIMEKLEETKRGLYSGTVGYFSPSGDFDFNVVIRSILYNAQRRYVSLSVGSAITAKSNPEREYEECLLKAKAMKYVLLNSN